MRVFSVLDQTKRKKRYSRSGGKASPKVERVEFSPDATLLAVFCEAGQVGPWDVLRGERAFPGQEPEFRPGTHSTFHPSGRWLIGTSAGGGLAVYDLESKRTAQEQGATTQVIGRASLTPDGSFLVCSRFTLAPELRELTGQLWDPGAASRPAWTSPVLPDATRYTWNTGLTTLADGERFATAEVAMWKGGQISLRSVRTGEILQTRWIGLNDSPEQLVIAPGDSYFVAQVKRHLHVWTSFDPDERKRTLTNVARKHFTAAAFHPSGKYLAATSNDESVKVYDVATWEVAKVFQWKIGRMRSIAFSRDGMLAAAGGDQGLVVVWDVDL